MLVLMVSLTRRVRSRQRCSTEQSTADIALELLDLSSAWSWPEGRVGEALKTHSSGAHLLASLRSPLLLSFGSTSTLAVLETMFRLFLASPPPADPGGGSERPIPLKIEGVRAVSGPDPGEGAI